MTQTIYRPVPGYLDLYAGMDSSIIKAGIGILEQKISRTGYYYVYIPGERKTVETHRLIAAAFLGARPPGIQTRHGIKGRQDNGLDNLCYGTPRDNMHDAIAEGRHGAIFQSVKNRCPGGHEYTPENTYRDPQGRGRQCRKCRARQNQKNNAARSLKRAQIRSAPEQLEES